MSPCLTLAEYSSRVHHALLSRRDGVLEVRLHTGGAEFTWGADCLQELCWLFSQIGLDRDNRCVIITGTGQEFCARMSSAGGPGGVQVADDADGAAVMEVVGIPAASWDTIYFHAKQLHTNLLSIECPVIAAVNGPALIRADIALLSDIVIASNTAEVQDAPHFANGIVPGDGVHLLWPLLLGPNRGRHFLLTGQKLAADKALEWGVVSEVHSPDRLLERAHELAAEFASRPVLTARYACARRPDPTAARLDGAGPRAWARPGRSRCRVLLARRALTGHMRGASSANCTRTARTRVRSVLLIA